MMILISVYVLDKCFPTIELYLKYWCISKTPIFQWKVSEKCKQIKIHYRINQNAIIKWHHSSLSVWFLLNVLCYMLRPYCIWKEPIAWYLAIKVTDRNYILIISKTCIMISSDDKMIGSANIYENHVSNAKYHVYITYIHTTLQLQRTIKGITKGFHTQIRCF